MLYKQFIIHSFALVTLRAPVYASLRTLYYTFSDGASPAFEFTSKTTLSLNILVTHFVPTYSHQQAHSFFYRHTSQPLESAVILLHFSSSSTVQLGVLLCHLCLCRSTTMTTSQNIRPLVIYTISNKSSLHGSF